MSPPQPDPVEPRRRGWSADRAMGVVGALGIAVLVTGLVLEVGTVVTVGFLIFIAAGWWFLSF